MMESKKGIKQIGPSSFLYSNSNDRIYNIAIKQSENSIYFSFIKMRLKSVVLFEGKAAKEDFRQLINKGNMSNGSSESGDCIVKEIAILIYNQAFTIKEDKDCLRFVLAFEGLNRNMMNKEIKLRLITQDDNNKETNWMNVINKQAEIIERQSEAISRLERNEAELLNRMSCLEKIIQKASDAIMKLEPQNSKSIGQIQHEQSQGQSQMPQFQQQQILPSIMNEYSSFEYPNSAPYYNTKSNLNEMLFNGIPEVSKFNLVNKNDYTLLYKKQSNILKLPQEMDMIYSWINNNLPPRLTLIYQASKQGFSATQFHNCCDDAESTLTIIQTDYGLRFGGFTKQNWKGEECYKTDLNAFLFNIDTMKKYPIKTDLANTAICCRVNNLAVFGNGYDIAILDKTKRFQSLSNFPVCYGAADEKLALTGGHQQFNIVEIETYLVDYFS